MLVDNFLSSSALRYPDKVALVTDETRFTYRELNELANRLANALIAAGFTQGDRAVINTGNSLETVVSLFGVLKAGGVFVVINPAVKEKKMLYLLNNCRATAFITFQNIFSWSQAIWDSLDSLNCIFLDEAYCISNNDLPLSIFAIQDIFSSFEDVPPAYKRSQADLAALIYTSGSTGFPKGVMMSHQNMTAAADAIIQYLENTENDVILDVHPLSFDYGLYQVLMAFKVGGTVILKKHFGYPYSIISTLQKEKVTGFPIVPAILSILDKIKDTENLDFPHLRYITNTADTLTKNHIKTLKALFPETEIFSMYGLTECKRVSYLHPKQLDIMPTSVGKPMPGMKAYIVDEEGKKVGPGIEGELVVHGPNVMLGYWENARETDMCLRSIEGSKEKLLYTKDLFKMDEDGYLYFIRRKDDMIKVKGEKVSPKEIENIIAELPGINQVAVVGIPDHRFGQAIKATIVLNEGVQLEKKELFRHCSMYLEDNMIPHHVEFRNMLPRTDSGKISKSCMLSGLQDE
jgi:amino acid adenylation domain-containing protein